MASTLLLAAALALLASQAVLCDNVDITADGRTQPTLAKRSAIARGLVRKDPKVSSVIAESSLYFKDTSTAKFPAEKLVYVTPWNNHGYDVAKIFAGTAAAKWSRGLQCCRVEATATAHGGCNSGDALRPLS